MTRRELAAALTAAEGHDVTITLRGGIAWRSSDSYPITWDNVGDDGLRLAVYLPDVEVTVEVHPDPEPTERGTARITSDGRLWVRWADADDYDAPWVHHPAERKAIWAAWADLDDPRPAVRAER